MSRSGSAPPLGAVSVQRRSPARIALAVGLLVLGVGALAVINFVLVPLRIADGNYRLQAMARYPVPELTPAAHASAAVSPAPDRPAPAAGRDAEAMDTGRADQRPHEPAEARPARLAVSAPPPPATEQPPVPPEEFPDLLFAINTTWLSRTSRDTLDRVAEALALNPERRVVLSGHTDGAGDPVFNRALSRERALKAAGYLRMRGVAPPRIEVRAFGAKQPVAEASRDTPARNRRVEIAVQ